MGAGEPRTSKSGWISESPAGLVIAVHVSPGARRDGTEGVDNRGELRVRVSAPAERGRANDAVEEMIALRLGVRKSAVRVVAGHTSRRKRVEVRGGPGAEEAARLLVQEEPLRSD